MILASWQVLCELAPWLLLGMLLSGLLHAFLPKNFVRRKFQGVAGVLKAVLLGVPLPLCSCGVVPAGIGLKNQGASDGAAVGFLISTPQTGIDSILVSASFFGWPFAIFKMLLAAITGIAGGVLADSTRGQSPSPKNGSMPIVEIDELSPEPTIVEIPWWLAVWRHAIEILASIWVWLAIGVVLSAAIQVWLPPTVLARVSELGMFLSMLLMLLISIPMYVCATASVPIAAALVQGGLHPATALVFLMAGPATNVATIGAIRTRFGTRVTIVYLTTLIVGSMLGAWLFEQVFQLDVRTGTADAHNHMSWFSQACAVFLLVLMLGFTYKSFQQRSQRSKLSEMDSQTIHVTGMHCGSCVGRLENALRDQPGVTAVHVDLQQELATIAGSAELTKLHQAIEAAGFSSADKN